MCSHLEPLPGSKPKKNIQQKKKSFHGIGRAGWLSLHRRLALPAGGVPFFTLFTSLCVCVLQTPNYPFLLLLLLLSFAFAQQKEKLAAPPKEVEFSLTRGLNVLV